MEGRLAKFLSCLFGSEDELWLIARKGKFLSCLFGSEA